MHNWLRLFPEVSTINWLIDWLVFNYYQNLGYTFWLTWFQFLLNYLAFQYFDYESTRWTLFQKPVVCTKIYMYVFIHLPWKAILADFLTILFKHFGLIAHAPFKCFGFPVVYFESTRWRLFQKRIVWTKIDKCILSNTIWLF